MYWRLSLLTGCRIVLLQFACSALLLSLHLLVADITVGFVEEFSAKYVPRGGVCYLLSSGRGIPRGLCDACYDRLDPLQGVLINSISNAMQVAKHDVIDWTCTRGWLNLPLGLSMEHEIYKASNTLRSYCQV